MPYGYLGQNTPNQTVSNSGVFSITDVAELQSQGKLGGSLELIESQSVTSGQVLDLLSIQEQKYDVHLLTLDLIGGSGASSTDARLRLYENGVLETASVYQYAYQYNWANGTSGEFRTTTTTGLRTGCEVFNGADDSSFAYTYLYNLGNSSKYSFNTFQASELIVGGYRMNFGGGVLPQASLVNGIRVYSHNAIDFTSLTAKLYGVKQL